MFIVLTATLLSCRSGVTLSVPVLTLLPAAFEGGEIRNEARCGRGGEELRAAFLVSEPSLTFTLRGRSDGGAAFAVAIGSASTARESVAAGETLERTFRLQPPAGRQTVTIRVAEGELCLTQLALTQP